MNRSGIIKFRLLIILKDSSKTRVLINSLLNCEEFTFTVCNSIKDSVELIKKNEYEAILVGLDLPDSKYDDIRTFYELVLSLDTSKMLNIAFIILTEGSFEDKFGELEFRALGFKAGAQDIFYMENIENKIDGLIRCIQDSTNRTKYIPHIKENVFFSKKQDNLKSGVLINLLNKLKG